MRHLIRQVKKARAILLSIRGESLMEGVVSILVFAILAAAVSMMIITSLRMTSVATREATASQNEYNGVIKYDPAAGSAGEVEFELEIGGDDVEISVPVIIYNGGEGIFTAFAPAP